MAYAHSRNQQGIRHDLVEHLRGVATLAAQFAAYFGAAELAYYLGLWHDLGKFHPDFQRYLLKVEAGPSRRIRSPDHKATGTRIALEHGLGPIALVLQGHHGGLKNRQRLRAWYEKHVGVTDSALEPARKAIDIDSPMRLQFPDFADPQQNVRSTEFFLRFLFSVLVDADFLDTERHFSADRSEHRGSAIKLAKLSHPAFTPGEG